MTAWLHRVHFRTRVRGLERVPNGPCLLVANHSGQLPFDAAVLATTLLLDTSAPRLLRVIHTAELAPRLTGWLARLGHLRAHPSEVQGLLEAGETVLVFPEGIAGLNKPSSQRYQLQGFDEEFVSWAVGSGCPVVPVSVVGAEEQYLCLANLERVAHRLGLPAFPLVPQWLLPGGTMPLPSRYHLEFGEPMYFEEAALSEPRARSHSAWLVRQMIQHQLGRALCDRRSWWR
jgi:1-acyl-sn-glycerol-3-phosphate acyltransferase